MSAPMTGISWISSNKSYEYLHLGLGLALTWCLVEGHGQLQMRKQMVWI